MDIKGINQRDLYNTNVSLERAGKLGNQPASAQGAQAPHTDTVSVSAEGVLRTEAYRTAMNTPDIRQDKVNAIKDQIANGTYIINSTRIAASLLNDEAALLS